MAKRAHKPKRTRRRRSHWASSWAVIDSLDTHSQQWAREHDACFMGRRALGRMSVGEYFNSPKANPRFLVYMAARLFPERGEDTSRYQSAVGCIFTVRGRWPLQRVRRQLLHLFKIFNVSIPARLL